MYTYLPTYLCTCHARTRELVTAWALVVRWRRCRHLALWQLTLCYLLLPACLLPAHPMPNMPSAVGNTYARTCLTCLPMHSLCIDA